MHSFLKHQGPKITHSILRRPFFIKKARVVPRTIDVRKVKQKAIDELTQNRNRIEERINAQSDYLLLRWMSRMTAVEAHAIWERYVENRLVAAINHNPQHFLSEHNIKGVQRVSYGLATYVVRGGNRFFDFRSMSDLIGKADKWLAPSHNTFRSLPPNDRKYIDALAAIRNFIVHGSDAAQLAYKRELRNVYGVHSAPQPDEFLYAQDNRPGSPARYQIRLFGLMTILEQAITNT
jgi:hypothetical protein